MEKDRNFDTDNRRKLKPWHGLLLFGIVMVSFYTIIAWAQMKWGMYGLALTELLSLIHIFVLRSCKRLASSRPVCRSGEINWNR